MITMHGCGIVCMFLLWLTLPSSDSGFVACPPSKSCSCLGNSIYCERASFKEIPWKKFPTWVEIISLRQIFDLTRLTAELVPLLPKLRQLNVTNCRKLVSVGGDLASKLPNLKLLRITQSALTQSPVFASQSYSLQVLILNNNNLTALHPNTSHSLPLLSHLEVNNNKLVAIRSSWFVKPNQITHLSANGNAIARLDPDLGSALPRLLVLRLNKNRMSQLRSPARPASRSSRGSNASLPVLPVMQSVQSLELARNRMVSIDSLTFDKWRSLRRLVLRKNFLRNLDTAAFYIKDGSLRQLDLTGNPDITRLDQKWTVGLGSLTHLLAARCGIRTINPKALEQMGSSLRYLDLSANKLTVLTSHLWKGLPRLQILKLAGNGLSRLPPNAFSGLSDLRELSLMVNSLSSLIPRTRFGVAVGTDSAFSPLSRLSRLDLSFNRLGQLRAVDLRSQAATLTHLDLTGNNLSRIEPSALTQLSRLSSLRLDSTRLRCSCRTLRLVHWLLERRLAAGVRGTNCSLRPPMSRLPLLRLPSAAARVCHVRDPPSAAASSSAGLPGILSRPLQPDRGETRVLYSGNTSVVLQRGNTLRLRCQASEPEPEPGESPPTPAAPDFRWIRLTGQLQVPLTVDERVNVTTRALPGPGLRWSSELRVNQVAVRDAGEYQCIFTRPGLHGGVDASPRIKVFVYVSPRFTDKPAPIMSAMAGETLAIPCAASGIPPPQSSLRKEGGMEFPAAKDFRLTVYPGETNFMLTNVKREDAGKYICESINDGGSISQLFTLKVNEIPDLLLTPASQRLLVAGDAEVLRCKATGWPFPRIRWLKDGKVLGLRSTVTDQELRTRENATTPRPADEDGRLKLASRDQMLVIDPVTAADAGVYTCQLRNVVGRKEARVVVDVRAPDGRIYPGAELVRPGSSSGGQGGLGGHAANWLVSNMMGIVVIAVVSCIVVTSIVWVAALFCLKRRLRRKACERAASLVLAGDSSSSSRLGGATELGLGSHAVSASVASLARLSVGPGGATPLLSSSLYLASTLHCRELAESAAMLSGPVDSALEEDAISEVAPVRVSVRVTPQLHPVDLPSSGYNSGNSDYSVGERLSVRSASERDLRTCVPSRPPPDVPPPPPPELEAAL